MSWIVSHMTLAVEALWLDLAIRSRQTTRRRRDFMLRYGYGQLTLVTAARCHG